MEKLTLENIAPYLPYGLRVQIPFLNDIVEEVISCSNQVVETTNSQEFLDQVKPVLRPMDLTKPIIVEGKEIVPVVELLKPMFNLDASKLNDVMNSILYEDRILLHYENLNLSLSQWKWLYTNKFDVENLIERGLAIDVNTLNTNPYA